MSVIIDEFNQFLIDNKKTSYHDEVDLSALVNEVINESMMAIFGSHYASKITETSAIEVNIVFIGSELRKLRGFAGYNTIYVNQNHFDQKRRDGAFDDLILIDVATVSIHELAHVRIRQVLDDLNMSTPTVAVINQEADLEFGRIVERKLFGFVVDWMVSSAVGKVPTVYVESFLNSIRFNRTLPEVPADAVFHQRSSPVTFHAGVDMCYEEYIE